MPDSHWAMLEIAPGELFEGEVSRWSSDSSDYTSASSAGGTDSAEEQPEIEDIVMETTEEKFERHRRFFQGEPLMRCLREEEDKYGNWMDTILFENLYHEVQYGLRDTRSQEEVREYWKEVRYKLRIDDSEIASSPDSFTENDTFSQIAPVFSMWCMDEGGEEGGEDPIFASLTPSHAKSLPAARSAQHVPFKHVSANPPTYFHQIPTTHNAIIMDPFSAEGELLNLHNFFHQGQFQEAIDFDTAGLAPENKLPARIISLRAQIALGQAEEVIANVQGESDVELIAVGALADWKAGNEAKAVKTAEKLASEEEGNATVLVLAGSVLQAAGRSEDALNLLSKHSGSLEAVALIVQIHLEQNRTDLAVKEVATARRWAQDSLLVNLAESWVGLRVGGEKYQQAFYVFEELAQAPSTSSNQSLISQAVAEIHLGRLEEAEAALKQALAKDPKDTEAIANSIVLEIIAGKDAKQLKADLQSTAPSHHFLQDLEEKASLFDKAATKYSAKVAAA
ncbi:related to coatomer epsilon subunit [Rhynchosporium graminicola]|uniref:Related to coatomer epsilon subunit n=1 Tax=Rhynchosporium graminicola TaxID=2792576 RepID=A0A1E1JRE4_9HELO|nr:related to coatomer epsilon subunit [Rhynchosporium commune]